MAFNVTSPVRQRENYHCPVERQVSLDEEREESSVVPGNCGTAFGKGCDGALIPPISLLGGVGRGFTSISDHRASPLTTQGSGGALLGPWVHSLCVCGFHLDLTSWMLFKHTPMASSSGPPELGSCFHLEYLFQHLCLLAPRYHQRVLPGHPSLSLSDPNSRSLSFRAPFTL